MKRLAPFLLLSLLFSAFPLLASAEQSVYWVLPCEAVIYANASENAMPLAIASEGQIVLLKAEQSNGWAHVEFVDVYTGIRFEGWFNAQTADARPELYDHTLANAQEETAMKLESFRSRVDLASEKPDFAFDGFVEEQFEMRCLAVVDSGEAYVRVDMRQEAGRSDIIDHFVVYPYDYGWNAYARVPVLGRLNATGFDAETELPAAFEGVVPYTLGSPHIRIAPVFRTRGVHGFDVLLTPAGGILRNGDGSDAQERITGTPRKDLPLMDFRVSNTGRRSADDRYLLQLEITAQDGSLSQTLEYASAELDFPFSFFRMEDMNFDGYMDLDIMVSHGAYNRLSIVSLWLPDERRFSEPQADQLLCNYALDPQRREITSYIRDGYAYHENTRFAWEDKKLVPQMREESYSTGHSETIGERVTLFSPIDGSTTRLWDEQYPKDWYTGKYEWVERERHAVLAADMLHQNPRYAVVDNVDWVHLRHLERKSSDSIGRINAGEAVQILRLGCGEDQGWVRVLWNGRTGYIWHSFLTFLL